MSVAKDQEDLDNTPYHPQSNGKAVGVTGPSCACCPPWLAATTTPGKTVSNPYACPTTPACSQQRATFPSFSCLNRRPATIELAHGTSDTTIPSHPTNMLLLYRSHLTLHLSKRGRTLSLVCATGISMTARSIDSTTSRMLRFGHTPLLSQKGSFVGCITRERVPSAL